MARLPHTQSTPGRLSQHFIPVARVSTPISARSCQRYESRECQLLQVCHCSVAFRSVLQSVVYTHVNVHMTVIYTHINGHWPVIYTGAYRSPASHLHWSLSFTSQSFTLEPIVHQPVIYTGVIVRQPVIYTGAIVHQPVIYTGVIVRQPVIYTGAIVHQPVIYTGVIVRQPVIYTGAIVHQPVI